LLRSEPYLFRRNVVLTVGALFFPSERCLGGHRSYFSGRNDVWTVTGLIFPVGTMFGRSPVLFFRSERCFGGHRSYFSGRDDVLAVGALFFRSERCFGGQSLIFPVGTMFWRSEPYFSGRDDVLAVGALFFPSGRCLDGPCLRRGDFLDFSAIFGGWVKPVDIVPVGYGFPGFVLNWRRGG